MDDALKSRFRAFAESRDDDEVIDDSGTTGGDLKHIAEVIDGLIEIRQMSFDQMNEEFLAGRLGA